MKRIVIGLLAAVVLTMGSGLAFAEEEHHGEQDNATVSRTEQGHAEEGTEVEVGLKAWWNTWKRSGPESFTSDSTFLVGPVAEVKFHNNLFVEAAALVSTSDYKASFLAETEFRNMKADRHDMDLAIGYMITHQIGAFVGYRNSEIKDEIGNRETAYGALAGVRGDVPVNEALSFYGKATYLMGKLKTDEGDVTKREKNPGWIFEAGAKYEFTKRISANAGYQYEKTRGVDSGVNDTFSGVTLGAMYAFE